MNVSDFSFCGRTGNLIYKGLNLNITRDYISDLKMYGIDPYKFIIDTYLIVIKRIRNEKINLIFKL